MARKLRNRPTTFIKSGRPKSAVFKFKAWPQKRSQNLFCNTTQTLLRILLIAGVLEGKMMSNLVGGKIRQFSTTFMVPPAQVLMLAMTFHPDKSWRIIHHVHQKHYSIF
jgi:hypothetical protein